MVRISANHCYQPLSHHKKLRDQTMKAILGIAVLISVLAVISAKPPPSDKAILDYLLSKDADNTAPKAVVEALAQSIVNANTMQDDDGFDAKAKAQFWRYLFG